MAEKCNIDELINTNQVIPAEYDRFTPYRNVYADVIKTNLNPFNFKDGQTVYIVENIPQFLSDFRGYKDKGVLGIKKRQCTKATFTKFDKEIFAFTGISGEILLCDLGEVNIDGKSDYKYTFYIDNPNTSPPPPSTAAIGGRRTRKRRSKKSRKSRRPRKSRKSRR